MWVLLALHAGCAGCWYDDVFGYASYQVVGTAIHADGDQPLVGAHVRMLLLGHNHLQRTCPPETAQSDDAGGFVLPAVQVGFGLDHRHPSYVVLEVEIAGQTACAVIEAVQVTLRRDGEFIIDVGVVVFDFAAGPCNLPPIAGCNDE